MEATIDNKELATYLVTLAIMCTSKGTDNCDIILTTSKGKINCHIEFSEVENDRLDLDDVLQIIDKYKTESEAKK